MTRPDPVRNRPSHQWWQIVGVIAAIVLVAAGLAVIAVIVTSVVAMNNFGSNK